MVGLRVPSFLDLPPAPEEGEGKAFRPCFASVFVPRVLGGSFPKLVLPDGWLVLPRSGSLGGKGRPFGCPIHPEGVGCKPTLPVGRSAAVAEFRGISEAKTPFKGCGVSGVLELQRAGGGVRASAGFH